MLDGLIPCCSGCAVRIPTAEFLFPVQKARTQNVDQSCPGAAIAGFRYAAVLEHRILGSPHLTTLLSYGPTDLNMFIATQRSAPLSMPCDSLDL